MAEYTPSRWWRLNNSYLCLKGSNCSGDDVNHFHARPICPELGCSSGKLQHDQETIVYSSERTKTLLLALEKS